jgi:hypothetical protein
VIVNAIEARDNLLYEAPATNPISSAALVLTADTNLR